MPKTVTMLPYLYRDAANWKANGCIYLSGPLDDRTIEALEPKLVDGDGFIPEDLKLGIPELQSQLESFPGEDDHVYHEFDFASRTRVQAAPEGETVIDIEAFLAAFEAIPDANGWDVAGAMERLGIEA